MNSPEATRRFRRTNAAPLTRRSFLALSGSVAAAASAAAVVGCGGKKRATPTGVKPNVTAVPTLVPAGSRGGVLRSYNFDAMPPDSLDPHLTQFGPIANMHSAIFSRVLRYEDERAGTIVPDLAESMPEQPDETTYIVELREDVTFHDVQKYRLAYPKTAGRSLTAADVKYSIERQLNKNSPSSRRFFRSGNWSVIDRIDARDARTLVIKLKQPVAPFLSFLAGLHAFVLPKEVVDNTDQADSDLAMIGTGPFMLESFEPLVAMKLRRNPQWFARDDAGSTGDGRPYIDGYDAFYSPQEDAFQRVAFERRLVDATGFGDGAVLDQERKTNLSDIVVKQGDAGAILASRLLLDRAPFSDDRARRAIHLAVDRYGLASLVYPEVDGQPSARISGPVAPAISRWALSDDNLAKRPGYRSDSAGRAEDLQQARQLWAAAAGDRGAGEVKVLFAGVPKTIMERAAPSLQRQLSDALGISVTPVVDASGHVVIASALGRNLDGATEGVTAFTFMMEDGGVDLDDWLYPHFRSGQPMNTYRLQDPQLDAMLDKSRAEFDFDARRQIGLDAQEYLLSKVNARIEYAAPVERQLIWGYVRNPHMPLWNSSDQELANTWLDSSHPAWRLRPA
ncbi:MAG: ABC transporter substrate-binding protein [Chloroflexota bacterium]|nr:ABC transporter substrate-binding protein [Chloroflexota bacterium]